MNSYAHLQMRSRELQNIIVAFGGLSMNSPHACAVLLKNDIKLLKALCFTFYFQQVTS